MRKVIGDFSREMILSDHLMSITNMVKDNGKREHKVLFNLPNAYEVLNGVLFEGEPAYAKQAIEEQWDKFVITDLIRGWNVCLIEWQGQARFIIEDYRDFAEEIGESVLEEVYLSSGLFDEAITVLYHELFSLYDQYVNES